MTSIHGHEVLTMMLADGQSWTTERLVAAIEEKFGQAARFYTARRRNDGGRISGVSGGARKIYSGR